MDRSYYGEARAEATESKGVVGGEGNSRDGDGSGAKAKAAAVRGDAHTGGHRADGNWWSPPVGKTYLCDERHDWLQPGCVDPAPELMSWRMRERMKTVGVALVLCLNIGTDPPDVIKTEPCARLECWIEPAANPVPTKSLKEIGEELQKQYERWQPRARYKMSLDPTLEDVKKLCMSRRSYAKTERVLFHYNGHGVPRPTSNGEIWVFNKNYTQYIPLSVYDLKSWLGRPAIYILDCSAAGALLPHFTADEGDGQGGGAGGAAGAAGSAGGAAGGAGGAAGGGADGAGGAGGGSSTGGAGGAGGGKGWKDCIVLAACDADTVLPRTSQLPADLFTSCLTTPIKVALRWFLQNNPLCTRHITVDMIDQVRRWCWPLLRCCCGAVAVLCCVVYDLCGCCAVAMRLLCVAVLCTRMFVVVFVFVCYL